MCNFRNLKADEIDVRVATITSKGFSLLLYKDARCDMSILDETVGSMNWQRGHTRENANCIVSIWDDTKKQWISKEDTGTESNTEKEKGLASDSFKRACFNWGIGRELYTSPFIWIADLSYIKVNPKTQKQVVTEKFKVTNIETSKDKVILNLEISDSKGRVVFSTKKEVKKEVVRKETEIPMITEIQKRELISLGYNGKIPLDSLTLAQATKYIKIGYEEREKRKKGAKYENNI